MKNFKKLTAAVAATLMAATMVVPMALNAFAATELTLTNPISTPADTTIQPSVKAYKVFDISWVDATAKDDVNVTAWASDVNSTAIITAWTTYLNANKADDAEDVSFTGDDTAEQVAKTLTNANANAFAKIVMQNLATTGEGDEQTTVGGTSGTYDKDNNKVTFTDIADGYYAMSCTVKAVAGDNYTAESLGMLTVVGATATATVGIGETGTAKIGLPSVEKKVKENVKEVTGAPINDPDTDEAWNDVADYNIGDPVPFKLYGTMPSDLDNYDAYYYEFADTLGSEFTITDDTVVTVKIDGTEIQAGTNMRVVKNTTDNTINVSFEDIKALDATKDSTITVEYSAVLNDTAKVGLPGQQNAVSLKYSNNPNVKYTPDTTDEKEDKPDKPGETPEDKVIVFTYGMNFEKTFVTSDGTPVSEEEISQAVFESAKFSIQDEKGRTIYVKENPNYTTDGFKYIVAGTTKADGLTSELILSKKETTTGEGDEATTTTQYVLSVKGLDDGTYKIVEDVAPTGFNKATPQEFKVIATTVNNQYWNDFDVKKALTGFSYKVDTEENPVTVTELTNASAELKMENRKGTSLPSTGGMGTTLFYLGGGAMVAIAGVFLITKKRMKKEEL